MSAGAPAVRLRGVAHDYPGGQGAALEGVDIEVVAGQIVALVGPSGAGKSTLLALLDGRLRGWRGEARVLGLRLDPHRAPPRAARAATGFVFQEFALVDRTSVRRNVMNGRLGRAPVLASLFDRFGPADHAAVERAMEAAGVADLAGRRCDRLSGGQRQRVAIARALAQEPRLLLADEPVSNLDPARAEAILRLLADAARGARTTLIFTSHQPQLATLVADRVIGLQAGRVAIDAAAAATGASAFAGLYAPAPDHARAS